MNGTPAARRKSLLAFRILAFCLLASGAPLATASTAAAAEAAEHALKGRIFDGAASARRLEPLLSKVIHDGDRRESEWLVPLANQQVRFELAGKPGSLDWVAVTGADGSFAVDRQRTLPPGARLVAMVPERGWYSATFVPDGRDVGIHLYPTTDSHASLRLDAKLVHDIVERDEVYLRVRLNIRFVPLGGALYVGKKAGSERREILRVPLPVGARVESNSGPVPGARWKISSDKRWLVIDEPVPGLPDVIGDLSPDKSWGRPWNIEYLLPPSQYFGLRYALATGAERFEVWALHNEMEVVSQELALWRPTVTRDPLDKSARVFDLYVPTPGGKLGPGQELGVFLKVDNAPIRQISSRALWWHGAFVVLSVVAILLGLLLGRKRAPPEAALAGLSSEEVLDRIAELDARFERREIREREYRRYRDALLEVAAEEMEGEAREKTTAATAPVVLPAATAPEGPQLPQEARAVLDRIQELEASESSSLEAVQQRAHLLEALYKALRQEPPGSKG